MDKYIKLLDEQNRDRIVKLCGRKAYEYVFGTNEGWSRIGIIDYYSENSSKFEKFEEISECDAQIIIASQREKIGMILVELKKIMTDEKITGESFYNYLRNHSFDNDETQIVGIMFAMGWTVFQNIRHILSEMIRIEKSIEKLFGYKDCKEESDMIKLRASNITRDIMCIYIRYEYMINSLSNEKYTILSDYFEQKIVHLSPEQKIILRH